jgi:hypothetical protein
MWCAHQELCYCEQSSIEQVYGAVQIQGDTLSFSAPVYPAIFNRKES